MKVVYDTCLFIDFLRVQAHQDLFYSRSQVRYLSPLVLLELRAGAKKAQQIRFLDQLFAPYWSAKRVIDLGARDFLEAGEILSKIASKEEKQRLMNDCLIALSARKIGALLLTSNAKDFERLAMLFDFKLQII